MTTNEILGWLCSHLLAFGAGMSLGFGFHLMMLLFAGAAIISVVLLHGVLYEEAVTPRHTYDEEDYAECAKCVGSGKVYTHAMVGDEKYRQATTCDYCGGTGMVHDEHFRF